jgi:hypothetical protein
MKALICNRFVSAPGKIKVQLTELQGFDLDPIEVDSVEEALKHVPDGVVTEVFIVPPGTIPREPSARLNALRDHKPSPLAHAHMICGELRRGDNLRRRRYVEALQTHYASLPLYTIEELQKMPNLAWNQELLGFEK